MQNNSSAQGQLQWSPAAFALIEMLQAPLGTRTPVGYQRSFVDDYVPNHSSLLPAQLAEELLDAGLNAFFMVGGAGSISDQFLLDLSWTSSNLEGNKKSLSETKKLFALGMDTFDIDEVLLLNHKDAIEFVRGASNTEGLSMLSVAGLQSVLKKDLLSNPQDLGSIRQRIVGITDSVYYPSNDAKLLEVMLKTVIDKANLIRNPVEAAFFLWVNVAYLLPFLGGNKCTSRVCANLPLLRHNCVPLSFWDVGRDDYAVAMLGVYEYCNVAAAAELFEFVYRRSIQRYGTLHEA